MNKRYQAFLNSPEWKAISQAKKAADGFKCQVCGATENLEVHHKTYEPDPMKGLLAFKNLITLCKDCHLSAHGYKYGMRQFEGVCKCRSCAWEVIVGKTCMCLRKESEFFGEYMDWQDVCEWYWPWTSVPHEDRMTWWPREKCIEYVLKNENQEIYFGGDEDGKVE